MAWLYISQPLMCPLWCVTLYVFLLYSVTLLMQIGHIPKRIPQFPHKKLSLSWCVVDGSLQNTVISTKKSISFSLSIYLFPSYCVSMDVFVLLYLSQGDPNKSLGSGRPFLSHSFSITHKFIVCFNQSFFLDHRKWWIRIEIKSIFIKVCIKVY